jgi:hypothetical protein
MRAVFSLQVSNMKYATTAKVSIIQTAFNNNPTHACNQHIIVTRGLRSHPVHHNFYQIQHLEIFQIATSSHQLHGIELDPSLRKKTVRRFKQPNQRPRRQLPFDIPALI